LRLVESFGNSFLLPADFNLSFEGGTVFFEACLDLVLCEFFLISGKFFLSNIHTSITLKYE